MSKKRTEYIILSATLVIFIFYWSSTILYNSPNNYVKIQFSGYLDFFGKFFEQRWNFFAPPPTHNNRLYYSFIHKENPKKVLAFEVFTALLERKRAKHPFNTTEDVLDYILSGSVSNINEILVNGVKISKAKNPEEPDEFHQKKTRENFLENAKNTPEYQTLRNYAKVIAKKNNVTIENYKVKITITLKEIPKFVNRHEDQKNSVEKVLFQIPLSEFD